MNKILPVVMLLAMSCFGATSSLKTAEDYAFTTPNVPNNISGNVTGTEPFSLVLRSEDLAFLGEAYTEFRTFYLGITYSSPIGMDEIPSLGYDDVVLKNSSKVRRSYSFGWDFDKEPVYSLVVNDVDGRYVSGGWVDGDVTMPERTIISETMDAHNWYLFCINRTEGDTFNISTNGIRLIQSHVPKISAIVSNFANIAKVQTLKYYTTIEPYDAVFSSNNKYINETLNKDIKAEQRYSVIDESWTSPAYTVYPYSETNNNDNTIFFKSEASFEWSALAAYDRTWNDDGESTRDKYTIHPNNPVLYHSTWDCNYSKCDSIYIKYAFITNCVYPANFDHLDKIDAVAYCSIYWNDNHDYESTTWINRQRVSHYNQGVITNFSATVPIQLTKTIVNGDRQYRLELPNHICTDVKQFFKAAYPDGMYDEPSNFVSTPTPPTISDYYEVNKGNYATFSNRTGGSKNFEIKLTRIAILVTPKYRTTFE